MQQLKNLIKLLLLLAIILWFVKSYWCLFSLINYEYIDYFLVFLGVITHIIFLILIFYLFYDSNKFKNLIINVNKKFSVLIFIIFFAGWLIGFNFLIDGIQTKSVDKIKKANISYNYWATCIF